MDTSPTTVADFRRLARQNRQVARQMSLRDARAKLLEAAAELDRIADELEAKGAIQALQAKADEAGVEPEQ
jgi:ribosomal protein S6